MKTKLTKLIAAMMILSMMILNFAPVLSYAIEATNLNLQGKDTNIKNVKFDVFFAEGNHEIKKEMMAEEETIINVMVKVENEGYLENSEVDFSKCNFNVELLEEDEFVESIENNILKLNKLSKGEEKVVSLKVTGKVLEELQADTLYKVSAVNLSGKYMSGEGKEEAVVSSRNVKLSWTSIAEENLEIEISKFLPVMTSTGSMLMVQEKVRSNIVDGRLPIKDTHIELNIPEIANELPEEIRVTGETGSTNGDVVGSNFGIENYTYDLDKKILSIDVENKADEKGNITWKADGVDEYLVTYIYSEEVLNAVKDTGVDLPVEAVAEVSIADEANSIVSKEINSVVNLSGNIGNIVDAKATINEKVSKGYMLTNTKALEENRKETEYKVSYEVEIGYSALIDGLNINVTQDKFGVGEDEVNVENSTYIKELVVNKEDLLKVIGENGLLNIINGENLVYSIGADTEVADNGYIVIDVSSLGLDHLSIVSDTIEEEGKLRFDIIKAVRGTIGVSEEDVKVIDSIVAGLTVTANNEEERIAEVAAQGKGELEGTSSKANISVDRDTLSTLQTNEDVKISAILETNSNDDSLYTNPVVEVRLPESFEAVDNIEANLYFDDELSISNGEVINNEDGTKSIRVNLSGMQTKYNLVSTGTLLEIKSDITLNALTPSKQETIKLLLLNENDGSTTETDTTIDTVSLPGLSLSVSAKDSEGNQAVSSIDDKLIGGLKVSQGKKELEVTTTILNNSDIDYDNYVILGRFLSEGTTNIETGVELGSNIATNVKNMNIKINNTTGDEIQFTKYYSTNPNATKDLTDTNNGWKTEMSAEDKSYMIVGEGNGKLSIGTSVVYTYTVEVPANLEYNASVYAQYALYSSNADPAYSKVYGYATGSGPEIKAQITSSVNPNTIIEADKVVKYTVEVRNTGMQDAENVETYVVIPLGMELVKKVGDNYEVDTDTTSIEELVENPENIDITDTRYRIDNEGNYFLTTKAKKLDMGLIKSQETKSEEVFMRVEATGISLDLETYAVVNAGDLVVKSNVIENRVEFKYLEGIVSSITGFDKFEVNEQGDIVINVKSTDISTNRENTVLTINLPNELSYAGYELSVREGDIEPATFNQSGNKLTFNLGKVSYTGTVVTLKVKGNSFSDGYSKNVNVTASAKCDGISNPETINIPTITINRPAVDFIQTSAIPEGSSINEGEDFTYTYTITRKTNTKIDGMNFKAILPKGVTYISTNYKYGEEDMNNQNTMDGDGNPVFAFSLIDEDYLEITLNVRVGNISEDLTAVSEATITSPKLGTITSNRITHYLKNTGADKSETPNVVDNNGNSNYNHNSGGNNGTVYENTHRISGTIWKDDNTNGARESNEQLIRGVRVILMDSNTGKIATDAGGSNLVTTSDSNGVYTFSNLNNGKYSVVFLYDTGLYSATEYQKQGVSATVNSDAVDTTIQYQGKRQVAAVINAIDVQNENIFSMDLGLVTREKFDLKLEKTVSSISVTTKDGTSTYKYGTNFAKVDVAAKDQNNATLAITYKLKITNEGHVAGRVDSIVDKLPKELEFSSSLNNDWYTGNDRNIYNDSVTNTLLQPGDSIEVSLVLTKRMNSNGYGLINNSAEINKASNDLGKSDIDSSPGNNAATEDDYSNADVLISVKTGQFRNYAILFIMSAIVLFVGTYTIRKNVMKGDEING